MKFRKAMIINIKGIEWTFILQTPLAYKRMHSMHGKSDGITYPSNREVYFNKSKLTPRIVRHELMHCYVESNDTYSSDMKADQVEDLCCVIVGDHGAELFHHCDKIIEYFSR